MKIMIPAELNIFAGTAALTASTGKDYWEPEDRETVYLIDHPEAPALAKIPSCGPPAYPGRSTRDLYRDARSWIVEYWSSEQIERIICLAGCAEVPLLGPVELLLLEALLRGTPIHGADQVAAWRSSLVELRVAEQVRALCFKQAHYQIELSVAFSVAGESHGAVLCAAVALGYIIDGSLAASGHILSAPSCRYHRYVKSFEDMPADQRLLNPGDYWRLATMQGLDSSDSDRWVYDVIETCLLMMAAADRPGDSIILKEITQGGPEA